MGGVDAWKKGRGDDCGLFNALVYLLLFHNRGQRSFGQRTDAVNCLVYLNEIQ